MATLPARTRTRTRRPWRCTHHTSAVPRGQADNNTLTPYRLYQTVISPSETDEELEGNDTLSTATPLVAPLMSGRVGDGDSDHFSLFAAAGTEIVVMADDDPDDDGARTNMLIELLDSSGTVLASSGEQALVPVTAPASDNYFVRITKSGGTEEDYRLVAKTYDPQPHDPTTLEATNAFSGPGIDKFFVTPSAVESPFEVETTIRINGDAPASNPGDVLAVDLRGVSGAEVPHPGSTAGSIPSLTHETIVYRNIEQLIVTDSREDNDSQDSATVLGSLKRITLNELSIDTMEDVDWFQYTAPDTGKLIINAHFATVAMDGAESPMGDFNGDGIADLATYDSAQNLFQFDTDLDGTPDSTIVFGHSGFTERPVAGDFNLDGIDDIGLWVGGRQGQLPKEAGEWFLLLSDQLDDDPAIVFDAFSPAPLGNDVHAQFGDETALPLFANLDPPVSGGGVAIPDPLEATGTWQNLSIPARPLIARRRRMSATTIRTTSVERHIRPARSLPLSRANTRRGAATQQPYLSILG